MHWFNQIQNAIHSFLQNPIRVLFYCTIAIILHSVLGGRLIRLARLEADRLRIEQESQQVSTELERIEGQLRLTKDSQFLERLAKDRLDMAAEDDLVFVFSSN